MIKAIFQFEIRYQLRQWLFWLVVPVFLLLGFGLMASDSGSTVGSLHRNSPFAIVSVLNSMTLLAMFVMTAFVASSAQRDYEYNTHALFFSKPVRKAHYLIGRFTGSVVVSSLVLVGCAFGFLIGTLAPWIDAEELGPFRIAPYAYVLFVLILPNLIFLGGVLFALASYGRSLLATYLGVVVFFLLYSLSDLLAGGIDNRFLASLLDPFGIKTVDLAMRYWTTEEKNTLLPALADRALLFNRLLWTGVGLSSFALSFLAFDPAKPAPAERRWLRRRKPAPEPAAAAAATARPPLSALRPRIQEEPSFGLHVQQFLHQARIEGSGVLRGTLFLVLLALGIGFTVMVWFVTSSNGSLFGTPTYPVTRTMLQLLGLFYGLLTIVLVVYSGEVAWKERSLGLHEVYDALPVPGWVPLAAKLTTLWLVCLAFLGGGALTLIAIQLQKGYFRIEPGLYLQEILIALVPLLLTAVLALFLQAAANHKLLGYLLMILYLVSGFALPALGVEHRLFRYADTPSPRYSDMNGFGHFLEPFFWYSLYWSFCAAALFCLAIVLRVRGTESSWQVRKRQAAERLRGPVRAALAVSLAGFAATGAFIYWNTNVLNHYRSSDDTEALQAEYEKKYRKDKDRPMPRIVSVRTEVDLFPEERRLRARGHYRLQNRTARPIDVLQLQIDPEVQVHRLAFRDHRLVSRDEDTGTLIYRLKRPLQPGEAMPFDFDVEVTSPGFVDRNSDTWLVRNGTFFNNSQYFPAFGYQETFELRDRNTRRKHGLPPRAPMAAADDLAARRNHYLTGDSDWIDFETVVSTTPGQTAIAPGYLQREWTADGRRYFHYKMDAPILHFYSYLSAEYTVRKDRWRDVAIEIYYHEPHTYNVDRMIDAVKKSLAYYTEHFGPYQHRQVRIVEFPAYAGFAQSFPNTIPYSEGLGFIADLRGEDTIDHVFYVTAHEVAHQWWGHQVVGAKTQGATMLSESLCQYSALMVMEKEYGREKMRRFLKHELDSYLMARAFGLVEELPLMRVEPDQSFVHYNKASLVFYSLRDAIGEGPLNRALRDYRQEVAYQPPPYTVTPDLLRHLEQVTPAGQRPLLDDLFRNITLFENRVTEATYARRADGRYDLDLTVEARKMRSDGVGKETPVPLNDWMDVGVFGAEVRKGGEKEEPVLYLRKHRITQPTTRIRLVVDAPPAQAGIDPYNKLVDRNSEDNRKKVGERTGRS